MQLSMQLYHQHKVFRARGNKQKQTVPVGYSYGKEEKKTVQSFAILVGRKVQKKGQPNCNQTQQQQLVNETHKLGESYRRPFSTVQGAPTGTDY